MAKFKVMTKEEANKVPIVPTELWLEQAGDDIMLMYRLPNDIPRSLLYIDSYSDTVNLFSGDCVILGLTKI